MKSHRRSAVSLTETLVVLAIIAVMAAFYVPAVIRAFMRSLAAIQGLR